MKKMKLAVFFVSMLAAQVVLAGTLPCGNTNAADRGAKTLGKPKTVVAAQTQQPARPGNATTIRE